MTHPNANREVFLASDQDDISVKQLFEKLAKYQNNQLLMLPIPKSLISFLASLVGKKKVASRLCSELVVDTTKNTQLLGWTAPYNVDTSLEKCLTQRIKTEPSHKYVHAILFYFLFTCVCDDLFHARLRPQEKYNR
jgi:nucleoside-diphosphate-sugar epimerase